MDSFNNRQINIITFLLNKNDYVSAKFLSVEFSVSIRTVRYDLDLIENWLNQNNATLVKIPNNGVMIKTKESRDILFEKIKFISVENRVLSKKERVRYITLELLVADKELTVEDISNRLLLSRNTTMKLIKEVKKYCLINNLELAKVHAKGFKIIGDENNKRYTLSDVFLEIFDANSIIMSMIDRQIYQELKEYCEIHYPEFNFNNIPIIFRILVDIQKEYHFYFTDMALAEFIIYLIISIYRMKKNNYLVQPIDDIQQLEEYEIGKLIGKELERKFDIITTEYEIDEITNHLIESKIYGRNHTNESNQIMNYENKISDITNYIIQHCENELNISFLNDSQLKNDLGFHLKSSLIRIKNNRQIRSDYTRTIKEKFPIIFQIVKESLETYNKYIFNDTEIAYITLHISAAYERNHLENDISTALVICQEGVSFLRILVTKLRRNIPELRIIETCSIYDYEKYRKDIDLIITTGNFKTKEIEVVKVNPFLDNDGLYKIRQTLIKLNKIKQIYKYNQTEKINGGKIVLLEDLLDINMINLNVDVINWEDAIRKASLPLVDYNKVDPVYVDNMVGAVKELGPYIVIMPGIAFAHARPDESVKETCMSMITLSQPVEFGSAQNDPVSIVFAFGAENGNDHIKALQDIAKFLALEENVEFLKNATDRELVLKTLINI
jgi:transcriptional antiterminator